MSVNTIDPSIIAEVIQKLEQGDIIAALDQTLANTVIQEIQELNIRLRKLGERKRIIQEEIDQIVTRLDQLRQ